MGLGDIAMQNIENVNTRKSLDWMRTGEMVISLTFLLLSSGSVCLSKFDICCVQT